MKKILSGKPEGLANKYSAQRAQLFAAILISVFLLAGCFGLWEDKNDDQRPAASSAQEEEQEGQNKDIPAVNPGQTGQTAVTKVPSFQDGDYYLEALNSKNLDLCAKVTNQKLRETCEEKIKAAPKQ